MSTFSALLLAASAAFVHGRAGAAKSSATARASALSSLFMRTSSRPEGGESHERLQPAGKPVDARPDHRLGGGKGQPEVPGLPERRSGHDGDSVLLQEQLRELHVVRNAPEVRRDVAEHVVRALRTRAT